MRITPGGFTGWKSPASSLGGILLWLLSLSALFETSYADDWPQWRGPKRDAISTETGLAQSWPEGGPPVAWQASGVGTGYSSVVVSQGRVFTIGRVDADLFASALVADTGKLAWKKKIGTTSRNPCSTPTVDGDRVYVLDPDGELICLNTATGDVVWEKRFVEDFGGKMMSGRGYGESPLIDGDALVCTPGGPDAAIVALNKLTGAVLWKTKIPDLGKSGREGAGFSSIVMTEVGGVRQYVQLVGRGVVGLAANDGRFLWGYNPIANETANIPTPVVRGDLVFVANGYGVGSVLLQIVPEGDAQAVDSRWQAKVVYSLNGSQFQNHHGGVLLLGDHLLGGHGSNNGLPTCLDLKTGRVLWKRRGPGVGSAAILAADGRLYFRYQNGLVALLSASDRGFDVQGTLQVPGAGGDSWTHPALANGRLYLREQDVLWTYDVRRDAKAGPKPTTPAVTVREVDPAIKELRGLGLTADRLSPLATAAGQDGTSLSTPTATPNKSQQLYQYAVDPRSTAQSPRPIVVTLTDNDVAEAGTVATPLMAQLTARAGPWILNVAGTRLSDQGLAQLAAVPGLVGLNLELCSRITDAGLVHASSAKGLRVLVLSGTSVSPTGLKALVPLSSLVALDLEVCDGVTDAACEPLGQMRQLQALVLKKTGFEKQGITDVGIKQLAALTNLESLNLYGNRMTDAGLVHLAAMTKLQDLNLSLLAVTDQGLPHLKPLVNLRHLELLYSVGFSGPTLTDAGMASLEPLANLQVLNLTGSRITDAGLKRLHSLKHLSILQLVHAPVTSAGINTLQAALPNCRVIKEAVAGK